jgi:hypothetical protein
VLKPDFAAALNAARRTIYDWINERRVERLIDALRLSRASGVAIENLAGDDVEKLAAPCCTAAPEAPGEEDLTWLSGSLGHNLMGGRRAAILGAPVQRLPRFGGAPLVIRASSRPSQVSKAVSNAGRPR